jgi:peptidoglycan glycosyltransferase
MNGPIRRISYGLFAAFALLLLATTYVQAVAADRYRSSSLNARVLLREGGQERGTVVDRNGLILATSVLEEGGRTFTRIYPTNDLFAHPLGYSAVLFGQTGLERSYSSDLRSRQDLTVSDLLTALFGGDLRPHSIRLTIDANLQEVAAQALGSQHGAIAAVNPQTGEILAYVSSPSFDPNRVSDPAYAQQIESDTSQPRLDRVSATTYPPASTFKLIVAAEALEAGGYTVDSELDDPSALVLPGSQSLILNASQGTCDGGGTVTLLVALARSCNIQFAQLAMDLGTGAISGRAEAFGFNAELDLELPIITSVFPGNLDPATLAQSALGERDVQASPLQMLNVVSAIANHGQLMTPYFVDAVFDADKVTTRVTRPVILSSPISALTAEILKAMMVQAVERGTAGRAVINGITVAGKTGTSETGPHVWFVGFAPAEDPSIAIVVLIENGGDDGNSASGGRTAAPIAQRLIAEWLSP